MALIVEDGSIVANANSYITEAEYIAWADSRFGASRSTAPSCDDQAEPYILRAMDYFEGQDFIGYKKQSDQPLQWPRDSVYIDGYYQSNTAIPVEVKRSIYELAYSEEQGDSELASVDRKVKREKVSSIEVEYADNSSSKAVNVAVPNAMKKLLSYGGSINRVFRI
ncbi:MAG: DnaT-like ssDNA-binding protein [Rickettsiales bacterium]